MNVQEATTGLSHSAKQHGFFFPGAWKLLKVVKLFKCEREKAQDFAYFTFQGKLNPARHPAKEVSAQRIKI